MKYRKKPVVVEAIQWLGTNFKEIKEFYGEVRRIKRDLERLHIHTLEGVMNAVPQDWIIKGVNGEFYPCKPHIFEKTYEKVISDNKGTTKF